MSKRRQTNSYSRQLGNKSDKGSKKRVINFNFSKIVPNKEQTLKTWSDEGLLIILIERIKIVGALTREEAIHQGLIKEYPSKIGFPVNSKLKKPTYLNPKQWAVMHLTSTSVEVVAGYIENDIFYIVFLDKYHEFWPTDLQSRKKNKR